MQTDRKVTQPIPGVCFNCQNIKYVVTENKNVILRVGNVHRVQPCMHSLFSLCMMKAAKEFLQ
jgi:hypothetical protein